MWFIFALTSTLGWGLADLFYKKSSDETDGYSHLKITVWVGLIMGATAIVLSIVYKSMDMRSLFIGLIKYLPASAPYIISMIIGYVGLRYLELSVVSPVQNASGALSAVCMLIWFSVTGRLTNFFDEYSVLDLIGTVVIVTGVILLAVVERKSDLKESNLSPSDKKYRYGALALIFPLLYAVFDTLGTTADGIILDGSLGLDLSEIDVLILYGFTFLLVGIIVWTYMLIRTKKPYNPFSKTQTDLIFASLAEEFGQVFYVYAMSSNPVLSAPMIASYCIVSVVLSRIFLKEKLEKSKFVCVLTVIVGIVFLGISEGLS